MSGTSTAATFSRVRSTYSSKHAEPQYLEVNGERRAVWPHEWGVTMAQVRELLEEAKSSKERPWDRANTVTTLVRDYIIPKTAGTGVGYALLRNAESPKEVNVMVSHAWQENAELFVQRLERTVNHTDVMFICALSLYQCEDGCGPSILEQLGCHASESPFRKVLEHIKARGEASGLTWRRRHLLRSVPYFIFSSVLTAVAILTLRLGCVPQPDGLCVQLPTRPQADFAEFRGLFTVITTELPDDCSCTWALLGCAMAVALLAEVVTRRMRFYNGRMVVCPNRTCDIYSRLWCVYEIFVATQLGLPVELARTLATGGNGRTALSPSRSAVCYSRQDYDRIRGEIEDWGAEVADCPTSGYDMVDDAIQRTMSGFRRSTSIHVMRYLWPLLMLNMIKSAAFAHHESPWHRGAEAGLVLAGVMSSYLALRMVRSAEGVLRLVDVLRHGALQFVGGAGVYYGASHFLRPGLAFPWEICLLTIQNFGALVANMGLTMLVLLLGAIIVPKGRSSLGLHRRRGLCLVILFMVFVILGMIVEHQAPNTRGQVVALFVVQSTLAMPLVATWHLAVSWGVKLRRPLLHPAVTVSGEEPPADRESSITAG